jgi:hypothetical protein
VTQEIPFGWEGSFDHLLDWVILAFSELSGCHSFISKLGVQCFCFTVIKERRMHRVLDNGKSKLLRVSADQSADEMKGLDETNCKLKAIRTEMIKGRTTAKTVM